MLNALWGGCVIVSFAVATGRWLFAGQSQVFATMAGSLFGAARLAVELMLVLFGTLTLWLGLMQIAQRSGLVERLAHALAPLLRRLMPGVPDGHPALGLVTMNFAANLLGLDNAATPIGLKAMAELQRLNPQPDTATDAQAMFLVINASSLTLLPVSILAVRAQQGAAQPAAVFVPILIATTCSTLAGVLAATWMQRSGRRILIAALGIAAAVALGLIVAGHVPGGGPGGVMVDTTAPAGVAAPSGPTAAGATAATATTATATGPATAALIGNLALVAIACGIVGWGLWRRVPVYDAFIDGARDGFGSAGALLAPLVAMLFAVGLLRGSGTLELLLDALRPAFAWAGVDARIVDALPTALVKPFSGSAARALMIETMQRDGVDSLQALLAATIQGSTETTFYVLAVYFGSVGIVRARHAIGCALLADAAGVVASVVATTVLFGPG